jgi:prevent-host-death family protein
MSETVGVRELRQNLSRYLRRVEKGERITVTERNRPVAVLAPIPEREDVRERLIAEGRIRPGKGLDLSKIRPIKLDDPYAGTKALERDRGKR